MYSLIKNALTIPKNLVPLINFPNAAQFHAVVTSKSLILPKLNFLLPQPVSIVPNNGFKVVGKPKRRCKACFFVRREERLYVLCKERPRHKQMSMVKNPRNTWILTHATQHKVRPW